MFPPRETYASPASTRRSCGLAGLALLPVLLSASARLYSRTRESQDVYEFSLPRMGTTLHLKFYAANEAEAQKAANAVFDRVEDLEQIFSDYRDDSELTQLSREGGSGPRVVSPEMFKVLESSLRISELSGGALDVTVGPVVELWRQARRTQVMPDAAALARAKAAVGYRNIELDAQNRTVFLKHRDMKLDVGAIAKGYAADQALALLGSRGINRALVGAGGDLRIGAPPPGQPGWAVVVDSPDTASGRRPCRLLLHDVGISTSGNSHQFADIHGRRFSHIIDPATDMGLEGSASSTVIARNGTTADGLATALSVMPPQAGLRAAESVEGASAYLVRQSPRGWEYYSSRGFPRACNEPGKGGR